MKKVLVIDDTPEIRMIIEETLDMFGFKTVLAEDGETGIAAAREHLPDLIICDVNMPKLDGFGTLAKLREHESTATIPFMFLTGAVERPNVRRGMEMGADDYLTKPLRPPNCSPPSTRASKRSRRWSANRRRSWTNCAAR